MIHRDNVGAVVALDLENAERIDAHRDGRGQAGFQPLELAAEVVKRLLIRYGPDLLIVHGGASGIDWSFTRACADLGVKVEVHPARWDVLDAPGAIIRQNKDGLRYNANAGPIRNAKMVAAGAGMCVAFHRFLARSRGTKDCVRRAIEAGFLLRQATLVDELARLRLTRDKFHGGWNYTIKPRR
jgi:hypothetical protein